MVMTELTLVMRYKNPPSTAIQIFDFIERINKSRSATHDQSTIRFADPSIYRDAVGLSNF